MHFRSSHGGQGGKCLLQLQQGNQMAAEYALTFWTVAASSGWNEPALRTLFRRGLRKEVQKELACRDDNLTLDALIAMAICLDNLLQECWHSHRFSPSGSEPEPVEVEVTPFHGRTTDGYSWGYVYTVGKEGTSSSGVQYYRIRDPLKQRTGHLMFHPLDQE